VRERKMFRDFSAFDYFFDVFLGFFEVMLLGFSLCFGYLIP
jgi:hypothetical protein